MNIIIAEDDSDSRVFLERSLKKQGYSVTSFTNGVLALEHAKQSKPDMIISDILMPDMDGFEFCRRIKADEQLKTIPFVFYTATFIEQKDEQLALALGASRFIVKPMEREKFLEIIAEVLTQYREQKLPVPEQSMKCDEEISCMYTERMVKKLEKKMLELEQERRALEKSEHKYRRLVENLREEYFFYSHGTDGVFTFLSPSITDVLGYSQNDFLKHYTEHLTPNPVNKKVKTYTELSMKGEVQPPYEVEIYHKDGSIRLLEIREVPVFDASGNVIAAEGIAHDITERKNAEVTLRKTLQEKEILLRELHHRVKNNLLTLYSLVDLQQAALRGNEDINEMLNITKQRIRTMGKVHQMLYQTSNLLELDFSEYIKSMAGEIGKIFKSEEQKIDVSLDLEPVTLTIDEGIPCALIVNELLMNAYRHAFIDRKNGHIFVSFSKKDDIHVLQIRDDGVGMPEELLSGEIKTLGLQLVTLLTKQLQGNILYNRDNGSIFKIVF
ncbi:MAG: response regulator [Nitrospirota bacterium]